jgi:glucosyl-3-phosphoglycerate synthase
MGDFFQGGEITTLHKLGKGNLERAEFELQEFARKRPIALILPCLHTDLKSQALKVIIEELKNVNYIRELIVALGPTEKSEFKYAKKIFSEVPFKTTVIWNTGERILDIYDTIRSLGLYIGEIGKGRFIWTAYGYILSQDEFHTIVHHNCDILTYSREILARLCYPLSNPNYTYRFCKGYYSRVTDRLHGRATRLLITPLVRALISIIGCIPILSFFDSFRYLLSPEFAIDTRLARVNRLPSDWSFEVGVLTEVYRNISIRNICQVDITEEYEHKHQILSPDDATKGLNKMCVDICLSMFSTLASEGIVFTSGSFETLVATFDKMAREIINKYEDDAGLNGLLFDRYGESNVVDVFKTSITEAAERTKKNPLGTPLISSWQRVISRTPDVLSIIQEAVQKDNS